MMPTRVCEILNAVRVGTNGSFTTHDIENAEAESRAFPSPPARQMINARPERWKICPICFKMQPIAEFLLPTVELRTVILFHREALEDFAYPCADISEVCKKCRE